MQRFDGIRRPSTDFDDVQSRLRTTPLYFDVDLSVARSLTSAPQTAAFFNVSGNVLYIDQLNSTGQASLIIQDDKSIGSTPLSVFAGFLARVPFTKIAIENVAQPGLKLRIIYGVDLDFVPAISPGSGTVTVAGTVSIADTAGVARTLANSAFAASGGWGFVPGQYSFMQLWNKSVDTRLIVTKCMGYLTPDTASAPLALNGGPAIAGTLSHNPINNYLGQPASTAAECRVGAAAVLPGNVGLLAWPAYTAAGQSIIALDEPIVIPPGYGLTVGSQVVNLTFFGFMQFYQEPI